MEEAGRIRRGYFVGGVGATQFALPAGARPAARAAPRARRAPRRRASWPPTDPANPYGALLKWPAPSAPAANAPRGDGDAAAARRGATRVAGARVVLVDGALVGYVSRGGRQILTWLPEAEPERSRAGRALATALATIARTGDGHVGGLLVSDDRRRAGARAPAGAWLAGAGFVRSGAGFLIRRERRGFGVHAAPGPETPHDEPAREPARHA